jgi:cytoskeletal protein RodZ
MTAPKRPNARPRPWEQGAELEPVSFGAWLRRQREMRDISLREIAESSKISLRYLEALEGDRFDVLPAPVFAKGFLREYAKFVGLSPDEVVNYYLVAQQGSTPPEEAAPAAPQPRGLVADWTYGLLLALGVCVLLGVVALLAYYGERRTATVRRPPPPIAAPPVAPAPVRPPPVAPAVAQSPLRVTIDFTQDCWVEAVADDERRISELRVQGESLQIEAVDHVLLTLGNAGAVRIEVNGRPFPLPGQPGEVVRDLRIDLASIAAAAPEGA